MYNNNNKIANISNSELTFLCVCVYVYALDKRTKNLQRCQLGAGLSHLYTHKHKQTLTPETEEEIWPTRYRLYLQ